MALTPEEAETKASEIYELRGRHRKTLDRKRAYLRGAPELTWLPSGAPRELQALAQMSRVNLCELVLKTSTQQMFVDGYESSTDPEEVWGIWQANRWDRKQIGVHKAAGAYGIAYATTLPAENDAPPVLRPLSPRQLTAAYGDDDDWPDFALEERPDETWRLYDDENTYELRRVQRRPVRRAGRTIIFEHLTNTPHDQSVCPVVRYFADEDLDDPVRGDIDTVIPLQDQVNLITFHLLVAEHYGAHGRKIFIGKMVKDLEEQLRSSANTTLTVNANPTDFTVEEVSQTALGGFIESREAAVRYLAAISQTPTHELLGTLANLSAAALIEAKESTGRRIEERRIIVGESHEQLLGQAGTLLGVAADPAARVRWKPVRDQQMFQFADMLATLAEKLGVPPEALWSELPFPDATIDEWRELAQEQRARAGESSGAAVSGLAAV